MKKITLIAFFAVLIIFACKHEMVPPGTSVTPVPVTNPGTVGGTSSGGGSSSASDTVCFNSQVLPLYQSYCGSSGCHSGTRPAHGLDLTTYWNIMAGIQPNSPSSSRFYTILSGGGEDKMPPGSSPQMTSAQITLIAKWINQGALNTTCSATTCDTTLYTYSNSVSNIISTYCFGCHGVAPGSGNVYLGDYASAKNVAATQKQMLLNAINYTSSLSAQNMPPAGKLSDCQILQITTWINKGMPQ